MPTDEQLTTWCERLRASDAQALEQLFDAFYGPLCRYARSLLSHPAAAPDIVQEVFVKVWEMRDALDPSRSVRALLYRMTRNRAYNHQRDRSVRQANHRTLPDDTAATPSALDLPDEAYASDQLADRLEEWIDRLPDRQREALQLSRYEGLSHDEVAEVMEISPRTVNNHLVRALNTLRDRIRDYEPELLDA